MRLVTHGLEGYGFENTCNNDKNLSKIQLEHEKKDELVAVVMKVVHELDCMMVVKEIENELLEEVEKLEWWFEQDIDDEEEEDEEDEDGGETGSKGKKVMNELSFYKMEMDEVSERYIAPCFVNVLEAYDGEINLAFDENLISNEYTMKLCLDYKDIGPSLLAGDHLTQEEATKEALAIRISQNFALLEEKEKVELDGKIVKEEEEAVKRIKGEALKEKDDPEAFIFPIRLEGKVNENALADTGLDITTMPYRIYETLGREEMKKGVTTIIDKFIILDIPINRDAPIVVSRGFMYTIAESDSDDEEEYQIKRNNFEATIYDLKPAPYLNCNDPSDQSLALHAVINLFRKISVWKKAVTFLGSLLMPLKHVKGKPDYKTMGTHDDEVGSSRSKHSRQHETMDKVLLPQAHHEFLLWEGYSQEVKSRYNTRLANLLPRYICSPCVVNWVVLNMMGCDGEINDMLRIRLCEAGSDVEILTSVAWIRAFNINEPIYTKICHEFYSTYEFDKVCADDELQTKKIIKFRFSGHAHSLTLLEFARRLGLYQAAELDEEGFNIYFEGGLRSDEHFNAQDYWLSISREENHSLSRSHASTIKYPVLRVIHKMIIYGFCQRTTGYDKFQKNELWLLIMFHAKLQNGYANASWLIARWMKRKGDDDVLRSLIALVYCKDLDTTTLRELIDSKGRLIPEDPQHGVPRVSIPRPPRASMQDLYDRIVPRAFVPSVLHVWLNFTHTYVTLSDHTGLLYVIPIQQGYSVSKLAEIFQQEIIRLHGTPTSIVSDRDPRFTSRFWKGLQNAWGTRLKFSTGFHPETDGQTERTIQTREDMLRSCTLEWTGNWDEYLCLVEFAYNNSWHASIKGAPFELLYGRKCRARNSWLHYG
nr:Gag protease polyprotein [Tanacetum cinerariifolium]